VCRARCAARARRDDRRRHYASRRRVAPRLASRLDDDAPRPARARVFRPYPSPPSSSPPSDARSGDAIDDRRPSRASIAPIARVRAARPTLARPRDRAIARTRQRTRLADTQLRFAQ